MRCEFQPIADGYCQCIKCGYVVEAEDCSKAMVKCRGERKLDRLAFSTSEIRNCVFRHNKDTGKEQCLYCGLEFSQGMHRYQTTCGNQDRPLTKDGPCLYLQGPTGQMVNTPSCRGKVRQRPLHGCDLFAVCLPNHPDCGYHSCANCGEYIAK